MTESIQYRSLQYNECERIREIDASQHIYRAWRKVAGILQLVNIDYHDPDYPEGFENHLHRLQQTIRDNGIAIGAFNMDDQLIGFASLNLTPFGKTYRYVLLDQLFISLASRRKGVGKQLFLLAASEAKKHPIEKLYICAGSSEETLAFYRSLGCVGALEIIPELYDEDPRDIHLEYDLY